MINIKKINNTMKNMKSEIGFNLYWVTTGTLGIQDSSKNEYNRTKNIRINGKDEKRNV